MIRPALPADAAAIRAVHEAAFPTALEADLVERLEADGDAVISLVAEQDGVISGHVLLSRMTVAGKGRGWRALGLAPVGVSPSWQKQGIGGALIQAAIERAEAQREEIIFLLGEPAYYGRFGFSAQAAAPFVSPYAGPYFMALMLGEIASPEVGRADYAPAFSSVG